ncbi:MAG TPA: acetate/propionate family kinase [Polyangiaceae bacterium]|nr:acetate/propionate family kinase [Polyangiaceae bacterium]
MRAAAPGGDEPARTVLAVNAGSSSLKLACFELAGSKRTRTFGALVERLGAEAPLATLEHDGRREQRTLPAKPSATSLATWVSQMVPLARLDAVGHRLVHGGARFRAPVRVTSEVSQALRALAPVDPGHLPMELDLLDALRALCPDLPHVACFDTAFHASMPRVARLLPLPRRFFERGIERFGFHGLAFESVVEELERRFAPAPLPERVILAHLGSGSSLCALRAGRSVDTTMSFTPVSGIPTSTRSGDIDAGLAAYLLHDEGLDAAAFERLVTHESGLLGLSETSADVRDLLARRATDERAADALAVYCYDVKKALGGFVAALGGIDALAFSGGVGEHAVEIRAEICAGLAELGIALDATANGASNPVISRGDARVTVHVVRADEEAMLARAASRAIEE